MRLVKSFMSLFGSKPNFDGTRGNGYQPITEDKVKHGVKPPPKRQRPTRPQPGMPVLKGEEIISKARTAIIGQECICPDGLGRVSEVIPGVADSYQIKVNTYEHNRGCTWAEHNVKLIPFK